MRKVHRWGLAVVLVACFGASGHLCNNIYRTPDRIIVKPEKQQVSLDRADKFRVFVQNNYHTYIHRLRLTADVEGGGVNVTVTPKEFRELKAGERVSFDLEVTAEAGAAKGPRALKLGVTSQEVGFIPLQQATNDELFEATKYGNYCGPVMSAETLVKRKDERGMVKLQGWARGSGDYESRATRAIGKAGDPSAIAFLRGQLANPNGWKRGNTLLALGLLKDVPETFAPYVDNRDDFVRYSALAALVLAGDKSDAAVAKVKPGLTHDDVYVRIACGWALAAILRDKAAVDVIDAAFKQNSPQIRVMAGDALVDIAERQLPPLK